MRYFLYHYMGLILIAGLAASSLPAVETVTKNWLEPSFHATFEEHANADLARGMAGAGGFGWEIVGDGVEGNALRLTQRGGHIHYLGAYNINTERGTVSFHTKGKGIAGEEGSVWLWSVRGAVYDFGIIVENGKLSLRCIRFVHRTLPLVSEVSIPLGTLEPDVWYEIVASWDAIAETGVIRLNDQEVTGSFKLPRDFGTALATYLGGGASVRLYPAGEMKAGNAFDDFKLWNYSIAQMEGRSLSEETKIDLQKRAEQGLYRRMQTLEKLQYNGGWQGTYTWPTKIGAYAQGRGHTEYREVVTLDKSQGSALIASHFLYAYDVLGDQALLDVARRTGDFLVSAQSERGYWFANYRVGPGILEEAAPRALSGSEAKFQDGIQSQSIAFLLALYKLTGEEKYYQAANRGGEFYLHAQNPDGSWSYKYDSKKQIGVTFRGKPNGGEINDYAMNDAINIMVLLYHYSKDPRYMEAVKRAGDWLVNAKISGNVVGWAQQYDDELKPAPARHHEPAAFSSEETMIAAQALIEVYRLSGDEHYLKPVRDAANWIGETFPDGVMYKYYDPATGRPVATWENKLYYLDDPDQKAEVERFPINPFVPVKRPVPDLNTLLRNADNKETEKGISPGVLGLAKAATESLNEEGLWIMDNIGGGSHTIGQGFNPGRIRAIHMLNYVEGMLTEQNLITPKLRHHGDLLRMAAPAEWYDVAWPE